MLDLNAQYEPLMADIRAALDKVFEEHHYIMGSQVKALEERVQEYLGIKHAIGCASGTDALVLAIKALGIGDGDEVITLLLLLCDGFLNLAQPCQTDICGY